MEAADREPTQECEALSGASSSQEGQDKEQSPLTNCTNAVEGGEKFAQLSDLLFKYENKELSEEEFTVCGSSICLLAPSLKISRTLLGIGTLQARKVKLIDELTDTRDPQIADPLSRK